MHALDPIAAPDQHRHGIGGVTMEIGSAHDAQLRVEAVRCAAGRTDAERHWPMIGSSPARRGPLPVRSRTRSIPAPSRRTIARLPATSRWLKACT